MDKISALKTLLAHAYCYMSGEGNCERCPWNGTRECLTVSFDSELMLEATQIVKEEFLNENN